MRHSSIASANSINSFPQSGRGEKPAVSERHHHHKKIREPSSFSNAAEAQNHSVTSTTIQREHSGSSVKKNNNTTATGVSLHNDNNSTKTPYLQFSDFQRSMVTSCTGATDVILIAGNPSDVIPHCVAHTALLGLTSVLLNDEVGKLYHQHQKIINNASSPSRKTSSVGQNLHQQLSLLVSNGAANDAIAERSILDVSHLKALSHHVTANNSNNATTSSSTSAAALSMLTELVLTSTAEAAKNGSWMILPEVSALPLQVWSELGKLLLGIKSMIDVDKNDQEGEENQDEEGDADENDCEENTQNNPLRVRHGSASSKRMITMINKSRALSSLGDAKPKKAKYINPILQAQIDAAVAFAREYGLDEFTSSPHFRFVTFLTPQSMALGRVLPPRITNTIKVVDTRGSVRTVHDLAALFASTIPLSERQFALLCIGLGDGRPVTHHERAQQLLETASNISQKISSPFYSSVDAVADVSLINASLGTGINKQNPSQFHAEFQNDLASKNSLLAMREKEKQRRQKKAASSSPKSRERQEPEQSGEDEDEDDSKINNNSNTVGSFHQSAIPSFLVEWPCAASLADARGIALLSSESASTAEYVDAALFALRETLLRSLREMIATAQTLDNRYKATRRRVLESRAMRTGQDLSELEQIEELKQAHSETHLTRLEKTPGWIFPQIFDWCLGCAPVVNVEKLPMISYEDLTFDDIVWVHEGVGDATACLRGSWQLSPVCLKCALPSVRGEITRDLNDALLVEGRTLLSLHHPAILGVYGICELPNDLAQVQGGNMILRPLLSAASMHDRWLDAQQDTRTANERKQNNNNDDDESGNFQKQSTVKNSEDEGESATTSKIVKQFALVVEPFEMSLEQLLVESFDRSRKWTVEQFLDAGVSILRALVHLSEKFVHRCVCPTNVVACSQQLIPISSLPSQHQIIITQQNNTNTIESEAKKDNEEGEKTPESSRNIQQQQQQYVVAPRYQFKLSHFSACVPTNRRVSPAWLVETSPAKMPLRYCAPETFYGQFTSASDIWSFGVTMWTILHYCRKQPYEGLQEQQQLLRLQNEQKMAVKKQTASMKKQQERDRRCADGKSFLSEDYASFASSHEFHSGGAGSGSSGESNSKTRQQQREINADDENENEDEEDDEYEESSGQEATAKSTLFAPQFIAEGVASGEVELSHLAEYLPDFFWTHVISPCIKRRPQERPDARSLISTIMLLKVQHKKLMNELVDFESSGY